MPRAAATRHQRNRTRLLFVIVASLAAVATTLVHRPPPASASPAEESAFVDALNEVRSDNGLAPLTVNTQLSDLSRGHAQVMADAGEIFHANPISGGYEGPWSKFGENVGVGANVDVLVDAFVASPGHFANIIDPAFSQIGVGVVRVDGALYTTHRFLQLPGTPATPTTAPPSTAPPTTAPVPPSTTSPSAVPVSTPSTTTTLAPLPPPTISEGRVIELLDMLEQVGT